MADNAPTPEQVFPVRPEFAQTAHMDAAGYKAAYAKAAADPNGYWAEEAKRLDWMTFPTKIKNTSFTGNVSIKWFEDGVLNASVSCLDRHLAERGDATAIRTVLRRGKVVAENIDPKQSSIEEVEQIITGMSDEEVLAAVR